jgi:branched-chain amino acid transport system substrate-binding protein
MNRRFLLWAWVAAGALAAGAVPVSAAERVKVGFIATFSGPIGLIGQHMYDGFMLGVEHAGGKLGGLGTEVLKEDDQLKPDVGLQAAKKLTERDRVDFVVGTIFSNVMMAIYKPVVDAKTFLISPNAGPSPIAGAQCSPWFFSSSWQNDGAHEAMGKHVQDKGYKRVYLMAPNYQAGKDGLAGFKRHFKGEVVGEVYTAINQPDYSAELAQLRAAKPDALYTFHPGGMGVNFVKQYVQAGLLQDVPLFSAFTVDETNLRAIGDAAVGAYGTAFWTTDLDNPVSRKFVADFEKKHGYTPSHYAAQSYDAALLIDNAVKAVGGKLEDRDALRAALRKPTFQSVRGGTIRYNTNHFPIQNFYLYQVTRDASGKLRLENRGLVFKDHADPYAKDCPMKW